VPGQGDHQQSRYHGNQQILEPDAHEQHHGQKNDQQHQRRSQVRLADNQQKGDQDDNRRRQQFFETVVAAGAAAAEIPRQGNDQRDLDQFRRLKGKTAEGYPALGPVGGISVKDDQHQQCDGNPVNGIGIVAEKAVVQGDDDQHEKKADDDPLNLFQIKGGFRRGKAETGAVDVQHPDGTNGQGQDQQRPVKTQQPLSVKFHWAPSLFRRIRAAGQRRFPAAHESPARP